MPTRRQAIRGGGLALAALVMGSAGASSAAKPIVIKMQSDPTGAHVRFNPIGLLVEPGQTVRWENETNVHTVTAYHPDNDNHALRIPVGATPFNSGYLMHPGDAFFIA